LINGKNETVSLKQLLYQNQSKRKEIFPKNKFENFFKKIQKKY